MVNLSQMQLGKFLELKRGYDLPRKNRIKGPYPVVSSSGISDFHQENKVAGPGVITGRYGTIGQVFFVEDDFWPLNTTLYVRDFKGNIPRFVYYFLKTLNWEQFNDKSGVPGVNRNDVHQEIVRVPTPSDQKQIAEILGTLDDKIELNRRVNETLEEMARALFRDWFIDFGPTRRQMDGATDPAAIMGHAFPDNKAAALAPLFPARLGEDGLPEGWERQPLDNFLSVKHGYAFKGEYFSSEIQPDILVTPGNFKIGGGIKLGRLKYYAGPVDSNFVLNERDMIVTMTDLSKQGDTLGYPAIVPSISGKRFLHNQRIGKIKFKCNSSMRLYFYYFMKSDRYRNEILGSASGSTVKHTAPKKILAAECVFNEDVVREFSLVVLSFENKIAANNSENQTLTALRDLLLPKLMSGEIQLKDAPMVQDTLDGAA